MGNWGANHVGPRSKNPCPSLWIKPEARTQPWTGFGSRILSCFKCGAEHALVCTTNPRGSSSCAALAHEGLQSRAICHRCPLALPQPLLVGVFLTTRQTALTGVMGQCSMAPRETTSRSYGTMGSEDQGAILNHMGLQVFINSMEVMYHIALPMTHLELCKPVM